MYNELNIRLEEVRKYSGLNVTSFGNQFLSVGAENIRKLIKNPEANPSYVFITELLTKYPEVSVRWLLFGEGEMLNPVEPDKTKYAENKKVLVIEEPSYCSKCAVLQAEINRLNKDLVDAKNETIAALSGQKIISKAN